jgi:hypothetical protein
MVRASAIAPCTLQTVVSWFEQKPQSGRTAISASASASAHTARPPRLLLLLLLLHDRRSHSPWPSPSRAAAHRHRRLLAAPPQSRLALPQSPVPDARLMTPDTVMPRPEAEQQSSSQTGQTERLMPLWALSTAAPPPAPSTDPSPVTIATATNIDTTTADTSDTNVAVLDEDTFEALGVPIDGTLARHSIRYSIILRRQRGQPSTNSLTSTVECALAHVAIRPALVVLSHSRLRRSHGYGSTRDDPRCHAAGPFHRDC